MNESEKSNYSYNGIYRAKVLDTKDPLKKARVKIWCPDTMINIPDDEGIWAIPANNQLGGRNKETKIRGDHYFQGTCFIPPIGSWVWIFFQYGNPSLPCYFGCADLENVTAPAENRVGDDYDKKWTIVKTRQGRAFVVSDDPWDERWEITGKKRLYEYSDEYSKNRKDIDPSNSEDTVFPIYDNQNTFLLDERDGHEQFLMHDRKGNFIHFNIEHEKLHIYFHNNILIESDTNITLRAKKNINIQAGQNLLSDIGKDDIKTVFGDKEEEILGSKTTNTVTGITNNTASDILTNAAGIISTTAVKSIYETSMDSIVENAKKIEEAALEKIIENSQENIRNGMLYDNTMVSIPTPPPVENNFEKMMKTIIDKRIKHKITQKVNSKYVKDRFVDSSQPREMRNMMKQTLELSAMKTAMDEVSSDFVSSTFNKFVPPEIAPNASNITSATKKVSTELKENISTRLDQKIKDAKTAKSQNVGSMKNVDQKTFDKAIKQVEAVSNPQILGDFMNDAFGLIGGLTAVIVAVPGLALSVASGSSGSKNTGGLKPDVIKKLMSKQINISKSVIVTDRKKDALITLDLAIKSFEGVEPYIAKEFYKDVIKELLNLVKTTIDKEENYKLASQYLAGVDTEIKQGYLRIKYRIIYEVTKIYRYLKEIADDIIKNEDRKKIDKYLYETLTLTVKTFFKLYIPKIENLASELLVKYKFLKNPELYGEVSKLASCINIILVFLKNQQYMEMLDTIIDIDQKQITRDNPNLYSYMESIIKKLEDIPQFTYKERNRIRENIYQTIENMKNGWIDEYFQVQQQQGLVDIEVLRNKTFLFMFEKYLTTVRMICSGHFHASNLENNQNLMHNLMVIGESMLQAQYLINKKPDKKHKKTRRETEKLLKLINKKAAKYYDVSEDLLVKYYNEGSDGLMYLFANMAQTVFILKGLVEITSLSILHNMKHYLVDDFLETIYDDIKNYNPLTGIIEVAGEVIDESGLKEIVEESGDILEEIAKVGWDAIKVAGEVGVAFVKQVGKSIGMTLKQVDELIGLMGIPQLIEFFKHFGDRFYRTKLVKGITDSAYVHDSKKMKDKEKKDALKEVEEFPLNVSDKVFDRVFKEDHKKNVKSDKDKGKIPGYHTLKTLDELASILPHSKEKDKPIDATIRELVVVSRIADKDVKRLLELNKLDDKILVEEIKA